MKQLHQIQQKILKGLLFAQESRYTDLKPDPVMENNQFDFHLDQLIKKGFIQKGPKLYSLTNQGKEYANRMDSNQVKITKQAKISVLICCTRLRNGHQHYLIYTRLKQPFYGCQGFITGKVKYGEKIAKAVKRELKEKTGLLGKPQIVMIKHYLVFDKNKSQFLEDKFMFLCLVKNPRGNLINKSKGKLKWVEEKDLKKYVTNHFESYSSFREQIIQVKNFKGQTTLQEVEYLSNKF